jgi:LmbE family N-acetylglucosaminyl deacetylase
VGRGGRIVSYTLVSFHAHPDDESLLTGGTLGRAAAEGHRVVLVLATSGEAGLAAGPDNGATLGRRRKAELDRAAQALGCARVVHLGYPDSGSDGAVPGGFANVGVAEAATSLARVLGAEQADALTIYDRAGGYGHPDHVQVHHVGVLAAQQAGTPLVLEATVNRHALQRALRVLRAVTRIPAAFDAGNLAAAYAAPEEITHRVSVFAYTAGKRAAMQAHASQSTADSGDRTLAFVLRLPTLLFRLAFGREWFIERGRPAGGPLLDDIFASLRSTDASRRPGSVPAPGWTCGRQLDPRRDRWRASRP